MPRAPDSDPPIKVTVSMPASVYIRLRDHAARTPGSNMSKLCRDGALRELAAIDAAGSIP